MTPRQSNNQWIGNISGSPHPKKFRVQKSAGKVFASIFFLCRIHLWFRLMGGLEAKSMTSQRNRAEPSQDGGYALLWQRYDNNKMMAMRYYGNVILHLQQYSHRLNLLYVLFIKTASSLIIFQRVKLSTRSITRLCWCNWRTFSRKHSSGSSPRASCSYTTMPRLTVHLQPRRNWSTWSSSVLITHPILRIWPHRTTTCSLDWKNSWKVAIFRPTQRSLLSSRPDWTDNILYFWCTIHLWFRWMGGSASKVDDVTA